MDFSLDTRDEELLAELRAYLADTKLSELQQRSGGHEDLHDEAIVRRLGQAGWLGSGGPDLPAKAATAVQRWLVLEELAYQRLPNGSQTTRIVVPTLMRVGSEEQRRNIIPKMLSGEMVVALGYTEPDAGSDLASLRMRALSSDGGYVVSGRKLYITLAHVATHIWLAVRTDPGAERHEGISVLLAPLDANGITIRPLITQAGTRTNEVIFDDVFLDRNCLVGRQNEGWQVIRSALTFERAFTGSSYAGLAHYFKELVEWCCAARGRDDVTEWNYAAYWSELAALAVDLHVARLFSMRTAWLLDDGGDPTAEASMNKVWLSELRQRIASAALDIMGSAGQMRREQEAAPLGGTMEFLYCYSTIPKFAAGANEIQRDLIARRRLGMK